MTLINYDMSRLFITIFTGLILISFPGIINAQKATVTEEYVEMKTYPFSDPDPVPAPGRIYPYFYFNGYTSIPVIQRWKMVVLENDYIKVYVCPDIGGKVWGAIEKSTGNEFLYLNSVVKFRDVAMRGAWTSGGLEYNFGDIGHIPTCATPVDYFVIENPDGSVSCVTGAIDLPSGTRWNVEIILRPGEAFFETKATWYNGTSLPVTYYQWMNAAAKASGDLEFIYPGSKQIGHGGEAGDWPVSDGRNLSYYANNNFGSYKSYHVINSYSDYFGGYWHDDDFGFGHWSTYDDKPGKKLWIWGLSRQGMIWESLLTDNDGQYIEFQAGKLFNQAAESSTKTPFKHREFAPHDADVMNEIWFPLKGTKGMVAASRDGVLNVERAMDTTRIILSALKDIDDEIKVFVDGELVLSERAKLKPLELYLGEIIMDEEKELEVILGDRKLVYNSVGTIIDRPVAANPDFDPTGAYGLYIKSLELEKQRRYPEALESYFSVVEMDPGFLPALNRIALGYYRQMKYDLANKYIMRALGIDTYDGEANYYLGLISSKLGNVNTAKSGFSIAMSSVGYRSAAAAEIARIFLREGDYSKALEYAEKAMRFNQGNLDAMETIVIAYRKTGEADIARLVLEQMARLDETSHFVRFESYLINPAEETLETFNYYIRNELPYQSYLDLAVRYYNLGCNDEALKVLKLAPKQPLVGLWLAFLEDENMEDQVEYLLASDPLFVFPYRVETAGLLLELTQKIDHWIPKYYLALIYWNMGREEEAVSLFRDCGKEPDFAPFYLARARLTGLPDEKLADLKRAVELAPHDWRSALALSKWYLDQNDGMNAIKIIEPFVPLFPEQPAIGVCYAEVLNSLGSYEKSVEFLEDYNVLPGEGATVAMDYYHEACLQAAFRSFENNDTVNSLAYILKAKRWPENLGAGKPYDVDERLEDFMSGLIYTISGDNDQADKAFGRVAGYLNPPGREENPALLLQLAALRIVGRENEAADLLENMISMYPENEYVIWAGLVYNKDYDLAAELRDSILNSKSENVSSGTFYKDSRFKLVVELQGIAEL